MKQVQESNLIITARAPGKLILSGEHAVVYGCPALALAIDRFATTTIMQTATEEIQFEFVNDQLLESTTIYKLQLLQNQIDQRYQKFTQGQVQIKEVIHNPLELIQYAFIYLVENLFLPITGGFKIQVGLTLPLGCGMGASAAVIMSLMYALVNYYGKTLAVDKYLHFGREIENLQHGRSSGLDLFLSLHGGCYFFTGGNVAKRELPKIPLVLVNTGKAKSSTGECVEMVVKHLQHHHLAAAFTQVTIAMDQALQQNSLKESKDWIKENHILLQQLGVVPEKVADFIARVAKRGSAAKVTGAGAIFGDQAGVVLVVGEAEILDLVNEYGYEVLPVKGEPDGLSII